jgi:hypothetical protein
VSKDTCEHECRKRPEGLRRPRARRRLPLLARARGVQARGFCVPKSAWLLLAPPCPWPLEAASHVDWLCPGALAAHAPICMHACMHVCVCVCIHTRARTHTPQAPRCVSVASRSRAQPVGVGRSRPPPAFQFVVQIIRVCVAIMRLCRSRLSPARQGGATNSAKSEL